MQGRQAWTAVGPRCQVTMVWLRANRLVPWWWCCRPRVVWARSVRTAPFAGRSMGARCGRSARRAPAVCYRDRRAPDRDHPERERCQGHQAGRRVHQSCRPAQQPPCPFHRSPDRPCHQAPPDHRAPPEPLRDRRRPPGRPESPWNRRGPLGSFPPKVQRTARTCHQAPPDHRAPAGHCGTGGGRPAARSRRGTAGSRWGRSHRRSSGQRGLATRRHRTTGRRRSHCGTGGGRPAARSRRGTAGSRWGRSHRRSSGRRGLATGDPGRAADNARSRADALPTGRRAGLDIGSDGTSSEQSVQGRRPCRGLRYRVPCPARP